MKINAFVSLTLLGILSVGGTSLLATVKDVPQPEQPGAPTQPINAASDPTDPVKIAEYQKRFESGYELQKAGKLSEALVIYQGILAEQPNARRSLLESGRISFQLGDLPKADEYLKRLHALEPSFPEATELLIQVNQILKRDVKVEMLIHDLTTLHASGTIPAFSQRLSFVRERIHSGQDEIIISQFFDFRQSPNTIWMAEVFDANGALKNRILLNYDPDATKALRAKDPKYASTEVFTWFGHVIKDQKVTEIDAYLQIFAMPDYAKFRSAMLLILGAPPKPIYSAPVP